MAGGAVTATAARPLPRTRSLTPQYVTLPLSEIAAGDRRLDAEVYLSDGFTVRRAIQDSLLAVSPLGQLARVWQPSRLKGIRVDQEHGAPFLAATQVFDIWPTPRKWLAPSKIADIADRYVAPGCILVTRSGTVGNVIIAYSAHAKRVISDDLLRVEIEDDPSLRSYLYTFLRTRFGRTMMRGSHYGNVIKHLEVSHLEQIPVPVLPRLRDEIHNRIGSVFAARDEAYRLDMTARRQFAVAMSDQPERLPEEGYAVRASRLFHGRRRLEAFAHSPGAQLVRETYERNSQSVVRLGEIARAFLPARFKRIYGEQQGTTYLDGGPIFKVNPELQKTLLPATRIDFDDYMVKRGWLLMACSGQIYGINGQAILADRWHEGKVVTHDLMRIVLSADGHDIRPGYLQTVLSHPTLGKLLVVSQAYGTSVPHLAPEDIERLPIPRLAAKQEEAIADAAETASELRMRANDEENEAVAKLEGELAYELGGQLAEKKRVSMVPEQPTLRAAMTLPGGNAGEA